MAFDKPFEMKDMTGTMMKTKEKRMETSPDYYGSAMVDGFEYQMGFWLKKSAAGNPYMSIAFTRKDEAAKATPVVNKPAIEDSDVPF